MPLIFYSENEAALHRSVMTIPTGEIQNFRKGMTELEKILRGLHLPDNQKQLTKASISGSFPVEDVELILAQNKDCTHLSFLTGYRTIEDVGKHYTILVPMKDIKLGIPGSGTIIDKENTIYTGICCQHPPFNGV